MAGAQQYQQAGACDAPERDEKKTGLIFSLNCSFTLIFRLPPFPLTFPETRPTVPIDRQTGTRVARAMPFTMHLDTV